MSRSKVLQCHIFTYIVHKKALTANNTKAGASGQTGKGKDITAVGVRFEHSRSNDSDYTFELAARNEYAATIPSNRPFCISPKSLRSCI